jgi:phosphotriesterase-related protein
MATIETVTGPVGPGDLGVTLAHEHLTLASEGVRAQWPHLYDADRERERAVEQVRRAQERGVRTIVDPSCMDLGRDVRLALAVAGETGIQLVMCTGIYGARYTFLPPAFANREADAIADAFVHDIEEGIQGTGVKAAFIKCAADEPGVTDDVEKILRAAARASLRTGRPIMAHTHPATRRGLEVMDVFDDEGVDPARVQLAHTGDTADVDHIEELLARGPFIGMDRYGLDYILPTEQRNATVVELCRRGYADRMMLSQDACATIDWYPEELVAQMVPDWHFTFLWEGVLPALREAGVGDDQIEAMQVTAPARWLAGGSN